MGASAQSGFRKSFPAPEPGGVAAARAQVVRAGAPGRVGWASDES